MTKHKAQLTFPGRTSSRREVSYALLYTAVVKRSVVRRFFLITVLTSCWNARHTEQNRKEPSSKVTEKNIANRNNSGIAVFGMNAILFLAMKESDPSLHSFCNSL